MENKTYRRALAEKKVCRRALAALEKIGALETPEEIRTASGLRIRKLTRIDRLGRTTWEKMTADLDDIAIARVFRAVVVLEQGAWWGGGCVGPAISLYRILQKRQSPLCDPLADWSLRYRSNSYVPFGSLTSARSLAEYKQERHDRREVRRQRHQEIEAEQETAKARKVERQKAHKHRRASSRDRATAFKTILEDLGTTDLAQRVSAILASGLPLDAIALDLLSPEALRAAAPADLVEFLARIGNRRAPWTKVRQAILAITQ